MRDGERETAALVDLRRQQECSVKLAWSYPEADREAGAGTKTATDAAQDGPSADSLSPFLPARLADSPSAVMTTAEAQEAKSKCLQVTSCAVALHALPHGCGSLACMHAWPVRVAAPQFSA